MGAAFLFSIYRSPILNSHQNCPRMKAATAVVKRARSKSIPVHQTDVPRRVTLGSLCLLSAHDHNQSRS
jgi:hypothetical protein